MPVEVGPAGTEERMLFIDVRLRALASDPSAFGSTLAGEQKHSREDSLGDLLRIQEHGILMLGLDGDRAVGMARGERWDERPGVAGLFGMWVEPVHRGTGLARRLVEGVLSWARSGEFSAVDLDVTVDNLAAIRLYEAMGSRDTGERFAMPRDPSILEQRMSLPLT
jgi:ribosomal protein S18 acetylase RimI-like enzyme